MVCFLKKTVRSHFRLPSHFSENSVVTGNLRESLLTKHPLPPPPRVFFWPFFLTRWCNVRENFHLAPFPSLTQKRCSFHFFAKLVRGLIYPQRPPGQGLAVVPSVSHSPPPGTCLHLHRARVQYSHFSVSYALRFSSNFANSRTRAFR